MGTTSDKLTYLNETKTQIKDNLNFGGANITNETFRQYADKIKDLYVYFMNNGLDIVWNNWEKVIGSGRSITLNQTMEAPMKIDLKGNTSQNGTPTPTAPIEVETTTGRQEIDIINNIFVSTPSSAGECLLSTGEVTTGTNNLRYTTNYIEIPNNATQLYISGILSEALMNSPAICYYDENKTFISGESYSNRNNFYLNIPNNAKYLRTSYRDVYTDFSIIPTKSNETYKGQSYEINLGKNLIKSTLFTTTGSYNLASIVDGVITTNLITDYGGSRLALGQTLNLHNGQTIYVSCKIKSSTYATDLNALQILNDSNSQPSSKVEVKVKNPTISSVYQEYKIKITLGVDFQLSRLYFQHKGSTSDSLEITDIMISYSDTDYAPYKTPIELCKIGDYQDSIKKTTGKNLFSDTLIQGVTNYQTGVYSSSTTRLTSTNWISLEAGTYTINYKGIKTNQKVSCITFNQNGTYYEISGVSGQWKDVPFTFTTPIPILFKCNLCYNDNSTINVSDISGLQLEKGSSSSTYEPYGKDKWYIHKEIKKAILGVDINFLSTSGGFYSQSVNDYAISGNTPYCYWYKGLSNIASLSNINDKQIAFNQSSSPYPRLYLKDSNYTSVSTLNSDLSTNNVVIYYALATPTNTLITDYELINQLNELEKAKGYDNTTNIIQANDNLPFILDVRALKKI